jgi:hypothetical protein
MGHSHKQSSATLETVTCGIPARLLAEILYPNKLGILLRLENNGLARHDCLRLTPDRKLDAVGAAGPHRDLVRGGRLVRVKQRLVFGCLEQVQARLDQWRWKINTAFVEPLNLTTLGGSISRPWVGGRSPAPNPPLACLTKPPSSSFLQLLSRSCRLALAPRDAPPHPRIGLAQALAGTHACYTCTCAQVQVWLLASPTTSGHYARSYCIGCHPRAKRSLWLNRPCP